MMIRLLVSEEGKEIKVDGEILDLIGDRGCYITSAGYAYIRGISTSLHRLVYAYYNGDIPSGMVIDHSNRNRLDNRRVNLRLATKAQNSYNRPPSKNGSSKYKGVKWHNGESKWEVTIHPNRKRIVLGYYNDEVLAAMVYDYAALKLFGMFAYFNFFLNNGSGSSPVFGNRNLKYELDKRIYEGKTGKCYYKLPPTIEH